MSHQWIMTGVYKYFSGFSGEVYLNISPAPEKYYLSDTSPAPEKPGKYLKTPFQRRRSINTLFRRRRSAYIHLFGTGEAGEVFIYTRLTVPSCGLVGSRKLLHINFIRAVML